MFGAMMNFLIVDDHQLVREGLRHTLQLAYEGCQVLEADSFMQCCDHLGRQPDLDLLLLDIGLPDRGGIESLHEIRERWPGIPVIIISAHDNPANIKKSLEAGAMGFISKSSSNQVILGAIQLALSGGIYIPSQLLASNPNGSISNNTADTTAESGSTETSANLVALGITNRQADVLTLLMQGKTNKAICRELNLAPGTVKIHVSAVLRALGATNRSEAISIASRMGLRYG